MRVAPLGSVVTEIHGSVVVMALLSDSLICVQVAPASFERHTPRAYEDAYTMSELVGSSATTRMPRGVHGVAFAATSAGSAVAQSAAFAEPPWM